MKGVDKGKCKLPADQAEGNTAVQAAKDGSACYALGTKTSSTWTYDDGSLGAPKISIQYSTDTRSLQVTIICNESAATPVYAAQGEDPEQPGNYNLQLTSMYACKDKASTKTCTGPPAPAPPPPPPPQHYACSDKTWTCHPSSVGYNSTASCKEGCVKPPPPTYKCNNNQCIVTAGGVSRADCQAACAAPLKYKCNMNQCIVAADGVSAAACQAACAPPSVRQPGGGRDLSKQPGGGEDLKWRVV